VNGWQVDPRRLRALREEARWTPVEIATVIGCHRTSWNRYERGEQPATNIVWKTLDILTQRLGRPITMSDIATPKDAPKARSEAA
jgi:transcriptional regulator with XRE-family HTH domain